MKSFLIVGMGTFGHHLCRALADQKCEVMVADQVSDTLEDLLPLVVSAKVGDCTNEEVLRSFDIPSFDACFVCLGDSNVLGSLQITSLLKELGAKKVFSKADEDVQAKFLLRNGADEVVYPEKQLASWTAIRCTSEHILDYIELDEDYSIFELSIPEPWQGKSILQLDLRKRYGINVLGVRAEGQLHMNITPETVLDADRSVLILGQQKLVQKLLNR